MTDKKLKELIEDCCNDIFDRLEPLANVKSRLYTSLKAAINNTLCCKTSCGKCNDSGLIEETNEFRTYLCDYYNN